MKYASGTWLLVCTWSVYCICLCVLEPRGERDASEGKGSGWLGGLSPFLWFNLTPLALRLRQLHMHMPAILFVVGDYAAIKAPVSSSVAGQQNYCPPTTPPRLHWLRKLSPGLQSPVKTQVGHFILNIMNGSILLVIGQAVVGSPRLQTSVKLLSAAAYVRLITHQKLWRQSGVFSACNSIHLSSEYLPWFTYIVLYVMIFIEQEVCSV